MSTSGSSSTSKGIAANGLRVLAGLLLTLWWTGVSHAQVVDPGFPTTDFFVQATALLGDTLFIGGNFNYVGPTTGNLIAVDGSQGASVASWPRIWGGVTAITPDGSGGVFVVGGNTISCNGASRLRLAHIRGDGSLDSLECAGLTSAAYRIARWNDRLYLGGEFGSSDGIPRLDLVELDLRTGKLTSWHPQVSGRVLAVRVIDDVLYVGGEFTSIDGQPRSRAAAFDLRSGTLTPWNPGLNAPALDIQADASTIFLGGTFTTVGGAPRSHLAAVDRVTGLVTSWNPNVDGEVDGLAVRDSVLYVVGGFLNAGGRPRMGVAAFGRSGALLESWNPTITSWPSSPGPYVQRIAVDGPTVYLGGRFDRVGGVSRRNLAAVDAVTGALTPFVCHASDQVQVLAVSSGRIFAGGNVLASMGGRIRRGLAAIDVSSGRILDWNPGLDWGAKTPAVRALALQGRTLFAGGQFSSAGGVNRTHAAAFDVMSGSVLPWAPDLRSADAVNAIAAANSIIYIAGYFTLLGGQPRTSLAAVDSGSGAPTPWAPRLVETFTASQVPFVYSMLRVGSRIYVGGGFETAGDQPRFGMAEFDSASATVGAWNPDFSTGAFAIVRTGDLLGLASQNPMLTLVDPTTGLTAPNGKFVGGTHLARALAVQGNVVWVGGELNYFEPISPYRTVHTLTAIDLTTRRDLFWSGPLLPVSSYQGIMSLAVNDRALYAGGDLQIGSPVREVSLARIFRPDSAAPVVNVVSPGGGETWIVGSFASIRWAASDDRGIQSADVYLSRSGDSGPWELVAGALTSSSYDWRVSGTSGALGAYVRVVVHDLAGNVAVSTTPAGLSILDPVVPTFVERFRAERSADGVHLEWSLADPSIEARVQRSEASAGAFIGLELATSAEGRVTRALDRDADPSITWWYRLAGAAHDGRSFATTPITVPSDLAIRELALAPLAPNPSRGATTLTYDLPVRSEVRLSLLDLQGREVAVVARGPQEAGRHSGSLEAADLPSGLYFVRLRVGSRVIQRRFALIR